MKNFLLICSLFIISFIDSQEASVYFPSHKRIRRATKTSHQRNQKFQANKRILGGTLASQSDFRYQALLSYGNDPYCGASVIHERWALTARHCILENETNTAYITVGTNRLDGVGGKSIPVELFIPHPEYVYNPNDNGIEFVVHDIGLIRLIYDIGFSNEVQPIPLPPPYLVELTDKEGVIAGWGTTENESKSPLLQTARVRVLERIVCRQFWPYVRSSHLCTSIIGSKSACLGDSGGALVVDGLQYGIISTADRDCQGPKPNLYTDVSAYVPWIKEELERWGDNVEF